MNTKRVSNGIRSAMISTVLVAGGAAQAEVYHVDDDSPGTGDGKTWANAFNDIQDALAEAEDYDTIKVAQGTYKPGKATSRL